MKFLYFRPQSPFGEDNLKFVEIEQDEEGKYLEKYYELLNCQCIDIAMRKIEDKYYDFIVDDEGLLQEEVIISAIDDITKPITNDTSLLAGNLLIIPSVLNDEGEWIVDCDMEDYELIKNHIVRLTSSYIINGVEY